MDHLAQHLNAIVVVVVVADCPGDDHYDYYGLYDYFDDDGDCDNDDCTSGDDDDGGDDGYGDCDDYCTWDVGRELVREGQEHRLVAS